jgi:hypothetical protein
MPPPPQYLADQLTLFQPERADYPHLLLLAPSQCFSPSGITAQNKSEIDCKLTDKIIFPNRKRLQNATFYFQSSINATPQLHKYVTF